MFTVYLLILVANRHTPLSTQPYIHLYAHLCAYIHARMINGWARACMDGLLCVHIGLESKVFRKCDFEALWKIFDSEPVHAYNHAYALSHLCMLPSMRMQPCTQSGYDQYSFGISIGRHINIGQCIGLTDKENSLLVSVSADTVFCISTFTDTEKESDLANFGDFMVNTKVLNI